MPYPDHPGQHRQGAVARHAAPPDRFPTGGGQAWSAPPHPPAAPHQPGPGQPSHVPSTPQQPGPARAPDEPWPRIADDLYWLAHNDHAKLVVDTELIGLGLACAVLSELAWTRWIDVHHDLLIVVGRQPPPNTLAREVWEQLCAEPAPVPVPDWLRVLAPGAVDGVARRMVQSGDLEATTRTRLLRGPVTVYRPTDMNAFYWPTARLNNSIETGRPLAEIDRVLVGLCVATGVHHHVLNKTPASLVERLRHAAFTTRQPIPRLLRHLETVTAAAVAIR
ncbi:GOLPH3/VPS74 family protein [Actinoplanes utahensis]|uniref:GOLPH3/VPS74 family protein n=1 Tax=Actinoplanes utahensis TaxID=1869 RepID=UPI001269CA52